MEIQPGSGRRISKRIAGSVRYFGRSFFADAVDM
jgi:hypothetical protein